MRQHGTRAKYVADKCRCEPCTVANRHYQRDWLRHEARVRYGIEQPQPAYIDASETREHLRWLMGVGVGTRVISVRSGVGRTAVQKIVYGKVTKIRPATADKLLSVGRSAVANGALVDAGPTWKRIDDLRRHGWTNAAIDRAIGGRGRALQIGKKKVRASTARLIERLHDHALVRELRQREIEAARRAKYRHQEAA